MRRLWVASAFLLFCCGSEGGGGGSGGQAGSTAAGGTSATGCRFEQASCKACIQSACDAVATACYDTGWQSRPLCAAGSSAAATCNSPALTTGEVALKAQTDYSKCVLGSCASKCSG